MTQSPSFSKFLSLGPHGFHRLNYVEWGDRDNPHVVICVHGLTRNARDFDELASALAANARVVCLDVAGRGGSDWLDHKEDYGFPQYVADAAALIARVGSAAATGGSRRRFFIAPAPRGRPAIDWVGTSMGGLIGMMLASKPRSPIRRLVLNDVGAMIPWAGLLHLRATHGDADRRFDSLASLEAHLRRTCASFGPLTDAQWASLASNSARRRQDGGYSFDFDPGIIESLRRGGNEEVHFGADFLFGVDLWRVWDKVKSPTLLLRGEQSPLLTRATAERMLTRGPEAKLVEFEGVGHAPWLKSREQIAPIRDFLLAAS
jgi:pimeloyl-ACP methyl ester carboxylesterase